MNAAQRILIAGVRVYRLILSPAKTLVCGPLGQCRYTPSCSEYGAEAIRSYGAVAGSWLAFKRVCRCHPWGGCGHDPVPARPNVANDAEREPVLPQAAAAHSR